MRSRGNDYLETSQRDPPSGHPVDPPMVQETIHLILVSKMGGRGGRNNSPLQPLDFCSELGGWLGKVFPL